MAVADYIIEEVNKYNQDKSFRDKVLLSTRRLQRLLYFCETEYMLKNNGTPLFEDEFYAWPSGPVIEKIYYAYIQEQNGEMNPYHLDDEPTVTNDVKAIIDKILEATRDLDTSELMEMSKIDGGPHSKVFVKEDKNHGQVVSKEETYLYYSKYKSILQLFMGESLTDEIEQEKNESDEKQIALELLKRKRECLFLEKKNCNKKFTIRELVLFFSGLTGVTVASTLIFGATVIPPVIAVGYIMGTTAIYLNKQVRKEDKLTKEINLLDYQIDQLDLELNGRKLSHSYIKDSSFVIDSQELGYSPETTKSSSELSNIEYEQENHEIDDTINTTQQEQSGPRLVKRRIPPKK